MYKYIMIITVALTIFSGCAPKNYAVAGSNKIGLPFGTVLTVGGKTPPDYNYYYIKVGDYVKFN